MPLYEYSCQACHETVELLVSRPEDPVECPQCGGKKLERLMSMIASPAHGPSMPIARPEPQPGCGAPRCCGGICHE